MIDQILHEKIETYLLGKMPPQETRAFEAEIRNDPQLAEEVELHRLILPVPDRLAELELRGDFARWRGEMEPDPPPTPPAPKRQIFNTGTIVLLLLLVAGAFWLWRHYEAQLALERAERARIEKELEAEKLKSETLEREVRQLREDMLRLQTPADKTSAPPPPTQPGGGGGTGKSVVTAPPPAPPAPQKEPEYVAVAAAELEDYADNMVESLRSRGVRTEAKGEELVDKADTAIVAGKFREAQRLLTRVAPADPMYPKSLEMLAYVYFKRRQYAQAVNTYLKYRTFDGNTDKTDWDLCLFYLADYQRYQADFQPLLEKIIKDEKHPQRAKAVALRDVLADKGIWPN